MTTLAEPDLPRATNGEIAAINLERRAPSFMGTIAQDPAPPRRRGGDCLQRESVGAIPRRSRCARPSDALAAQFDASTIRLAQRSFKAEIASTGIASTMHEATSRVRAVWEDRTRRFERPALSIDQACGVELDAVLAARADCHYGAAASRIWSSRRPASRSRSLRRGGHRLSAGALLVRRRSPFPLALGLLSARHAVGRARFPVPDPDLAALFVSAGNCYLTGLSEARVHLAEIYASQGRTGDAEALLVPALSSSDPEVRWRLADVLTAQGRLEDAETQLEAARFGYEELLGRHLLAFADHATEFYAGSGNDRQRAIELARTNVANRPTRRAVAQVRSDCVLADGPAAASPVCTQRATREIPHAERSCQEKDTLPVYATLLSADRRFPPSPMSASASAAVVTSRGAAHP
jgi:hypothetical protein